MCVSLFAQNSLKNVTEAAEFADLCFSIKFDQTKKGSFARRSSPAAFNNVQVEPKQFKNDVAHEQTQQYNSATRSEQPYYQRGFRGRYRGTGRGATSGGFSSESTDHPLGFVSNAQRSPPSDIQYYPRSRGDQFVIPLFVDNVRCSAWRDTGCGLTLVRDDCVNNNKLTDRTALISGIYGEPMTVRLAVVNISSPRFHYDGDIDVEVGVVNYLPHNVDVLLGNDVFEDGRVPDIVGMTEKIIIATLEPTSQQRPLHDNAKLDTAHYVTNSVDSVDDDQCATTDDRIDDDDSSIVALSNKPDPTVALSVCVSSQGSDAGQADPMTDVHNSNNMHVGGNLLSGNTQMDSEITDMIHNISNGSDMKNASTTDFETEARRLRTIEPNAINPQLIEVYLTKNQRELALMQRTDTKLSPLFEKAQHTDSEYVVMDGILYKYNLNHERYGNEYLLVVPNSLKAQILQTAHDSVDSGCHLGYQNTARKILRIFYMPLSDIKEYVNSCAVCQRLRPKRVAERAEKIIPQLNGRFAESFVIDIVGPEMPHLSRQSGNHKYIIVCVCHSTRWIELIPVPSLKAKTLADALLVHLIARFHCKTLIYDQQSGFMSTLMQEVLKLLRINSEIAVAGFHARTSICERYIRTVEKILKSYIFEYKGNWNLLLPFIAFNLRQTPCATLGFSAHELTFGHNFDDRLNEIYDDLIGVSDAAEKNVKKDVITYINNLRDQLSRNQQASKEHALKMHSKTKALFDQRATKDKKFELGQKVLILEPDDTRKLYARWSEPREVIECIDNRNYRIKLDNNASKIFHVNQLRAYNERTEFINSVVVIADSSQNEEDEHITVIEDDLDGDKINFQIEQTLSSDRKTELVHVLNEFRNVFRPSLGRTDLATHYIHLTDDIPCVSPNYRIPESMKNQFEEEVNRLIAEGVLIECQSEYRSGIIPIKKPNGTLRLVNNFKPLNKKVRDDLYPMADPNEIISKAAGKRYISKIDLSKSYLQVPLAPEHQHFTAWSCFLGTFCWTRMAQGLSNAPRTMQRLMDALLKKTNRFASSMQDDIIIYSNSWSDHLFHIREILYRLQTANLTASITKSEFVMRSLNVLGWCLEDGLIKPCQKHVEAILKIGPQRTKHGVRALMGMIGYHRNMIPNFVEITNCLTDLLKKNQPDKNIKWQQRHTDALNKIKEILTSKPVLSPPIYDGREFILMTDITMHSVAGILSQRDDYGVERNIAYFSRKLIPRETKYSVLELEALGILTGCLKFHHIIYGYKVVARTDHKSLEFLDTLSKHNSRIARWKIILSTYDIQTEYRKAQKHSNCDGLSRVEMADS